MGTELLALATAALFSFAAGFFRNVIGSDLLRLIDDVLVRIGVEARRTESFSERLSRLTSELTRASTEVDETLAEISRAAESRQTAIQQLEVEVGSLSAKEKELKERVVALESVSLPAVEHFLKLSGPGERRSAWRDYILFAAGALLSTVLTIVLKYLGLG